MVDKRIVVGLLVLALVGLAAGCGGGGEQRSSDGDRALRVWTQENQPDRVRATEANVAEFARATGLRVELTAIGDDELTDRVADAAKSGRLPDVMQLPMASAHSYARDGTLNRDAAQDVVDKLGEETFSARALSLLTSDGTVTAVPSDGWGQMLIYRRDMFAEAGLRAPRTLEDVRRAARRLHDDRRGVAGVALATAPSHFTAESFEHIALAAGCQLLGDGGDVTLVSPECEYAFELYLDLARNYAVRGTQDVESTRDAYFAGRAAMIFWSPFLLDALAGLRDDAVPSCSQCLRDSAYLARNSGLVGPLAGPTREAAQYGTVSTWGITAGGDLEGAQRFVAYMMSDGYLRWLALSPQGKYPIRFGDRAEPDRYVNGWAGLQSGVERKAPLRRFYSESSIESIGAGARNFQRWGFEQGGAVLLGAIEDSEPIAEALAAGITGDGDAVSVARAAQAAVEKLDAGLE